MDGGAKNNNTTETEETWDQTDKCDLLRQGYTSAMGFEHVRINNTFQVSTFKHKASLSSTCVLK